MCDSVRASVCVYVCMNECIHTLSSQHHTCYGEGIPLLMSSSSFGFAFGWFSIGSLATDIDGRFYLRH